MGWSYEQLQATPTPVVDDVERWMREINKAEEQRQKELARKSGR